MWRIELDNKGQGGVVGGILGAVIATFLLYMYMVVISPINDLLLPLLGNSENGAVLLTVWQLIPLVLVFGIIFSIWVTMTSFRSPSYPPQY